MSFRVEDFAVKILRLHSRSPLYHTLDSSGRTNRKRKRLRILVQAGYTIQIRGHEYTRARASPSVVYIRYTYFLLVCS